MGWIVFNQKEPESAVRSAVTSAHERRVKVDIGSVKADAKPPPGLADSARPASNILPPQADTVLLPRGILRYLKADAINTELMVFKPAIIAALGLNEVQEESLNAALKSMARKAADFQMAHAELREDKNGGQYYQIKVDPSERMAIQAELESMVGASLPGAEPATVNAAWGLLAQSSILENLSYANQELAVVDSKAFGPYDNQPSVELKQFDDSGRMIRSHVFLATPELIEYRFPFLKQDATTK